MKHLIHSPFEVIRKNYVIVYFCNAVYFEFIHRLVGKSYQVQYGFIIVMSLFLMIDIFLMRMEAGGEVSISKFMSQAFAIHFKKYQFVHRINRTMFVVTCIAYTTIKCLEMKEHIPFVLLVITSFLAIILSRNVQAIVTYWIAISAYYIFLIAKITASSSDLTSIIWLISTENVLFLEDIPFYISNFLMIYFLSYSSAGVTERDVAFKVLVKKLPSSFWVLDQNLKFLLYGGPLLECIESKYGKFGNVSLQEFLSTMDLNKEETKKIIECHGRALSGQKLTYMASTNGEIHRVLLEPVCMEGERIIVLGASQDVTELVNEKEDRAASEESYKALVEGLDETIIKVDPAFKIKYINRNLMDKSKEDYIETDFCTLFQFDPDFEASIKSKLTKLFQERECFACKWSTDCLSAEHKEQMLKHHFTIKASPILSKDKSVVAATVIINDVTEKDNMVEQQRIADEMRIASQSKSQLLASISHEIRNPLNGILGSLQLLQCTEPLSDVQIEHINDANENAKLLLAILSDILDMSKMEHNRLELQIEPCSILNIVENVCNMVASQAYVKGLFLHTYVDCNLPSIVLCDQHRISQILLNFSSNSIKFTNDGSIILSAILVEETDNDCLVRFECKDTGIGIKEEDLKKIFKPYVQINSNHETKYQNIGWGLGLQICHHLAELMNGNVDVESTYGKGSVFYFQVRLAKEGRRQELPPYSATNSNENIVQIFKPMTRIKDEYRKIHYKNVVIATEDEEIATILHSYLEELGVSNVHIVNNAAGIIEYIYYYSKNLSEHVALITSSTYKDIILNCRSEKCRVIALTKDICEDTGVIPLRMPIKLSRLVSALQFIENKEELPALSPKYCSFCAEFGMEEEHISILIVEDNPINQKILTCMLQKIGIPRIDIADDGLCGLQKVKLRSEPYDLILMDLQMPVMNGFESADEIRKLSNKEKSKTPIVALTGASITFDENLKRLFDNILTKPVSIEQLQSMLRDIIQKRKKY